MIPATPGRDASRGRSDSNQEARWRSTWAGRRQAPSLGGETAARGGSRVRVRPHSARHLRPLPAVSDGVRVLRERARVGRDRRATSATSASTTTASSGTTRRSGPGRPSGRRALWNTVYYALLVVPLQMALGLTMALIVNAGDPREDVLPLGLLLPGARLLGGDLGDRAVPPERRRARQRGHQRGHSGSEFDQPWFGDPDTALESIIVLDAWTTSGTMMLFYLAALQSVPTRRLRGGGDRQGGHVAHVLEDHVPAAQAGALLRGGRVRHRGAQAVRPGVHHLDGLRWAGRDRR